MPDMDGYKICGFLKQGEKTKNIPVILLTGKELEPQSIQERCSKLGIEGFLLKPTEAKELIAKIEDVKNISSILALADSYKPKKCKR